MGERRAIQATTDHCKGRNCAVRELLHGQTSLELQALENYVDDPKNDGPECLTALQQADNPHSS